jgi:bla regulator protein blaR1
MTNAPLGPLADHLWQSTLVAFAVALLALLLRRNRAHLRYGLWMAASLKFVVPFAVLIALGAQADWPRSAAVQPVMSAIDTISHPFASMPATPVFEHEPAQTPARERAIVSIVIAAWALGSTAIVFVWIRRWRRVSAAVRHAAPVHTGRLAEALARVAPDLRSRLTMRSTDSQMEPGVFGFRAPVLLWPRGIETRLDDAQIDAILAHEIAHLRRHDNLTSAIHMAIQTVFWFHPLTWWIGRRLVEERERACDEAVVLTGNEPHVYAESILKTCQFFVESPLACVAGVTGSDLKTRIEHIMRHNAHVALTMSKRVLLSASLVAAVAGPVAIGVLTSPRLAAQIVAPGPETPTFEVASVKMNKEQNGRIAGRGAPGRFDGTNLPLRRLIRQAYDIHESQIVGGPDWVNTQGFDVSATTGGKPNDQVRFMMQSLLRDRFKLTFHTERRDMPIYALVVAHSDGRLGDGLKRTADGACLPRGTALPAGAPPSSPGPSPPVPSPFDPNAQAPCGGIIFGPGRLLAHGVPIDMLARSLGGLPAITAFNRIVQNQTGLEGTYDFDFTFANDFAGRGGAFAPPPGAAAPGDEPALFTAIQEQLGLKLDGRRANVEVLVIDSVQKPDEN